MTNPMTKITNPMTKITRNQRIGQRLRELRTDRGYSQQEVGDIFGVTFQQIQKYETGKNRISASYLEAISEHLDIPIQEFFEPSNSDNYTKSRSLLPIYRGINQMEDPYLLIPIIRVLPKKEQENA